MSPANTPKRPTPVLFLILSAILIPLIVPTLFAQTNPVPLPTAASELGSRNTTLTPPVTNSEPLTLVSPFDGQLDTPTQPIFTWTAHPDATTYTLIIKRNGKTKFKQSFDAATICIDGVCSVDLASVASAKALKPGKTYTWRIKTIFSGSTLKSAKHRFQTLALLTPTLQATNVAFRVPNYTQSPYPNQPTVQVTAINAQGINDAITSGLQGSSCKSQHTVIVLDGSMSGSIFDVTGPFTSSSRGATGIRDIKCRVTILGNGVTIQRTSTTKFRLFTVIQGGYLTLDNVVVKNGSASAWGGGGLHNYNGRLEIYRSKIQNNEVDLVTGIQILGGGIYSYYGTIIIRESEINANKVKTIVGDGGGIGVIGEHEQVSIIGNDIVDNEAYHYGNGVYFFQYNSNEMTDNCLRSNDGTAVYSVHTIRGGNNWINNWWGNSAGPIVGSNALPNRDSINSLIIDGTLAITYVPYLSAQPADCTRSIGTATNTPTPPPTPETLADYGVQAIGWDPDSDSETVVLSAVQAVAEAFKLISVASPPKSRVDVFRSVMGTDTSTLTVYYDPNSFPKLCRTDNNDRAIYCTNLIQPGSNLPRPITEYVIVHELGHVFDSRASVGGQERLVDYMDTGEVITDCVSPPNKGMVMGENQSVAWTRGERGWGTGPASYNANTPLFTTFQQNPLLTPFPRGSNRQNRIEEAAADMFLNWVYRRRIGPPSANPCTDVTPETGPGFLNKTWLNQTSTTETVGQNDFNQTANENAFSGSHRFKWMNDTMTTIFITQGW